LEQGRLRANRALNRGEPEVARALLVELVGEHPQDARLAIDLGAALSRLGRTEEAQASFRRALELDPVAELAYVNLAACELDLGLFAEALASADHAVAIAPLQALGHVMRGRALLALGRKAEGRASLLRAYELAPGDRLVQRALEELGESPP
jgi:Flp pilus assembly protein TadD